MKLKFIYVAPLIILPLIILLKVAISSVHPYYTYWDSSLLYATDSLLINGGLTPAHLFHPDIGALWFEKFFIFPAAKFFGLISISTIQEFQASYNPYLNMADVVSFLLLLRASYVYIGCSFVYFFTIKLLEQELITGSVFQRFVLCLGATVFSFSSAVLVNTINIRYEYVGFMWWSIALVLLLNAVKTNKNIYIIAMGFFAGWAFLSKIVLLPNVILLVLLYYVLSSFYNKESLESSAQERKTSAILSFVYLVIVGISLGFIGIVLIREELIGNILDRSAFLGHLQPVHFLLFGSIFPIYLGLQTLLGIYLYKKDKTFPTVSYYFHRLVLFSFSFYIPMLIILLQKKGTHIFTNVYIFSFALGQIPMSLSTGYNSTAGRVNPNTIIGLLGTVLIIIIPLIFYLFKHKKHPKYIPLLKSIMMLGIIILLNKVFLRGNEAQLPFYSLFISFLVIIHILYNIYGDKKIKILITIFVLGASFYQINTLIKIWRHPPSIGGSTLFHSLKDWYGFSYGGNGLLYPQTLTRVYKNQENWEKAFFWARDIYKTKGLIQTLQESPNQLQDTAILFPNSLLSGEESLVNTSSELRNALSIPIKNNSTISLRLDYDFYIVSSKKIEKPNDLLQLTDLKFETDKNNFFVYSIAKPQEDLNYLHTVSDDNAYKYLVIQDRLAKSL